MPPHARTCQGARRRLHPSHCLAPPSLRVKVRPWARAASPRLIAERPARCAVRIRKRGALQARRRQKAESPGSVAAGRDTGLRLALKCLISSWASSGRTLRAYLSKGRVYGTRLEPDSQSGGEDPPKHPKEHHRPGDQGIRRRHRHIASAAPRTSSSRRHGRRRWAAKFRVFSLDTGRLHPETYQFLEDRPGALRRSTSRPTPAPEAVQKLVRERGYSPSSGMATRSAAASAKVEPLTRRAEVAGRLGHGSASRSEPGTRAEVPVDPDSTRRSARQTSR